MFRWSFFTVILAAAACGGGDGYGGRPSSGDVGQMTVTPECGALSQACIAQGLNAPLALGSELDLTIEYKVPGSSGPPTVVASADPTVVQTPGTATLAAVGEGMSAVLFVGPADEVMDIIHVWVAAPAEMRIMRYSENGALLGRVQPTSQLLVGDEIFIAVEPYANSQPLLGNFELTYDSDTDAVAIVPDPVLAWYRVVARTAGVAHLTFSGLGLDATWDIEVLP
jgi:hypothetical protein